MTCSHVMRPSRAYGLDCVKPLITGWKVGKMSTQLKQMSWRKANYFANLKWARHKRCLSCGTVHGRSFCLSERLSGINRAPVADRVFSFASKSNPVGLIPNVLPQGGVPSSSSSA